jgi:hemolysin activation/secretion protein
LSVPGASPLRAPAGAETLDVLIDGVSVEGGFAQLAGETTRLEQSILDRRVTVAELYAFANALEVAYEKAGFVLVRTALPPQQLDDHGRLRVLVIDGYVSSIDVKGLPARVRDVIAARVAPLINQRHLTLPEIERSLLIAGDVPGVSLRSTLTPGTAEGATVLVIEGTQKLVTGTLGIDDRLPGSEGTWQYMGSLAVNSPFGFGEQFYTSFGLGADIYRATSGQNPLRLYGGGVVVPLGVQGLTINPEYSRTATSALPIPGAISSIGTFSRYSLHLSDALIRSRTTTLGVHVSLEHVTENAIAPSVQTELSLDHYYAVRVGADYATGLPWGTDLAVGFNISRGLGGRGQAQAAETGVTLSAEGAAPNFSKMSSNMHLTKDLPAALRLDVSGTVQSSFGRAMLRGEQLGLTDNDSASAFATGSFSVDQGGTLRLELSRSLSHSFLSLNERLSPYIFGAGGRGHLVRATMLEPPVTDVGALGVGLRGSASRGPGETTVSFGLELGRQFTDVPAVRQGWRWNFSLNLNF